MVPIVAPGGSDSHVQYNNGNTFGGASGLAYNDATSVTTATALTVTNASVISSNSVVFQPGTDAVTFLQIKEADSGAVVFNVDTTNIRLGVGEASPDEIVHVTATAPKVKLEAAAGDNAAIEIFDDTTQIAEIQGQGTGNALVIQALAGHQLELRAGGTLTIKIDSSQVTYIGDGGTSNYTQYAADGEHTMIGTARVVKYAWVSAGAVRGAGAAPASEAVNASGFIVLEFADAADDYAQ